MNEPAGDSNCPLISVIIPIFNQANFISECLDSVLDQTYKNVEVIVVDNGSEDDLHDKLLPYEGKIYFYKQILQGGNAARNLGLNQARGKYIQFLDADDYILPHKFSEDIDFLEANPADVLYRDWRHQYEGPDSFTTLGDIHAAGKHDDILYALLNGWWVAPCAVLVSKERATKISGWDETLYAAQDTDFMYRLALSGAIFKYLSGHTSVYRRHGPTVSTSNRKRWLDSHLRVLCKVEKDLKNRGSFTTKYKECMAKRYFGLAQNYFRTGYSDYKSTLMKIRELYPSFKGDGSIWYRTIYNCLGFRTSEYLAMIKQSILSRLTAKNT